MTLKGVAMMSGEYACVHTGRIFDGPANRTVIDGMARPSPLVPLGTLLYG